MRAAELLQTAGSRRACVALVAASISLAIGFPALYAINHGLNAAAWPPAPPNPMDWLRALGHLRFQSMSDAYVAMLFGRHAAFTNGGVWDAAAIVNFACATAYLLSRRWRPASSIQTLWAVPDVILAILTLLVIFEL